MNKIIRYMSIVCAIFLIISSVTILPATSKPADRVDAYGVFIETWSQEIIEEINDVAEINEHTLHILLESLPKSIAKNDKLLIENTKVGFLDLDTINITIIGILSIVVTLIIGFVFGMIAIAFPQFLPIFVKYVEILLVGTFTGAITDISIVLFQNNYEMINDLYERIFENQNISSFLSSMTTKIVEISMIPGIRGAISAFTGVFTALTFLKLWDLYKIIQMIGGGFFFSIPVTIPIIIYVLLVDRMLTQTM